MSRTEYKVSELVEKYSKGELRLPAMQRGYVWKEKNVCELLDSLYRGYPSGGLLLWKSKKSVPLRSSATAQDNPNGENLLLLDGQQRITSLVAVVTGKQIQVRDHKKKIEILFNLNHPDPQFFIKDEDLSEDEEDEEEEDDQENIDDAINSSQGTENLTFSASNKHLEKKLHWVKVSDVLKSSTSTTYLKQLGIKDFDDPRIEGYEKRLTKLRDILNYGYVADTLEDNLSYAEISEIFVRVNSKGTKLKSSDLALAQISAEWNDCLSTFELAQKKDSDRGFRLDIGVRLRSMLAIATGTPSFDKVKDLKCKQLQDFWLRSDKSVDHAIDFLQSNVSISDSALLAYPSTIVVLAYYFDKMGFQISQEEEANIRKWVIVANLKSRYAGSSDTSLEQDISALTNKGTAVALLQNLNLPSDGPILSAEELKGYNKNSPIYKAMFLAFRANKAKDWISNLGISIKHQGKRNRLHTHHIFPRDELKKAGVDRREINEIANLTFIAGGTNQTLGSKLPKSYIPELMKKSGMEIFDAHAVPLDENLLEMGQYKEFLAVRRELIAKSLNTFINGQPLGKVEEDIDSNLKISIQNGESATIEFKQTLIWDVDKEKKNDALSEVAVKVLSAFANTEGGTLLIGVKDEGSLVGLKPDYDLLKGDRDKFQTHLRTTLKNSGFESHFAATKINITFPILDGIEICRVHVSSKADKPVFIRQTDKDGQKVEKFFIRDGNKCQPLDGKARQDYIEARFKK